MRDSSLFDFSKKYQKSVDHMSISSSPRNQLSPVMIAFLAVANAISVSQIAHATENGTAEYPIGAESIDVALQPPPGHVELQNYNEFYTASVYSGGTKLRGSSVGALATA